MHSKNDTVRNVRGFLFEGRGGYPAAHREAFPSVVHQTGWYENNRAEVSHQRTREDCLGQSAPL